MNPYEQAIQQLEQARIWHERTKAHFMDAEAALAEAEINLAAHETSPGIPLPQYRTQVTA